MRNKPNLTQEPMFECPTCDSAQIHTESVAHRFTYGVGDAAVELTCQLPVRVCESCGGRFVDEVGETVRQETICRHLNRLTPREIHQIRDRCGTQGAFGALTGIGGASLSRWETGAGMPTEAYDNYLYLLMFSENLDRLRDRAARIPLGVDVAPANPFQCIQITEARLSEQRCFSLRLVA
jgi:putative zinc finger/helix-turn-helix YgiT family protein